MKIKIKRLHREAILPKYANSNLVDAGMDLHSLFEVSLYKDVPTLVKTGLSLELPPGYEAQIRSRSGLALNRGISVLNSPGTVDPGYRGEIGVILVWNGFNPNDIDWQAVYQIHEGDRIAQMVISQYVPAEIEEVENLSITPRGAGGFGSTGL